ncbi:MAG: DUF1214 domain-containing protein [Myxococcota bacterium]
MADRQYETTGAFAKILDTIREFESTFLTGERAVDSDVSVIEGYRWIFSVLQVAFDCYVWGDSDRPFFVDIVGRYKKWGGDNADAYYQFAPIDPRRTYRVHLEPGDAVYLSLSVYEGPNDGQPAEGIVGSLHLGEMEANADGSYDIILSAEERAGNWIGLSPESNAAITRDYLANPMQDTRATWTIEAEDPPVTTRITDHDMARRFRAATNWLKAQGEITPIAPIGDPNTMMEPLPVGAITYGWGAGDASYGMGNYDLAEGEALVIRGTTPKCPFWNLCIWNEFLHTYNYDYERVSINGHQITYEDDGSWTIVVSEEDPGHPNWIRTQGHRSGVLWARWFLPEETPPQPTTEVVRVADLRNAAGG